MGGGFLNRSSFSLYFKVIATYIGSIIGAGFATGQEIMQFFVMFGDKAIYAVILSTFLFSYLGAVVLYLSSKLKTEGYGKLFNFILGKKLDRVMDIASLLMLIGGLGIMFAGSGAVFSEHFGLSKYAGIFMAVVVTCIVIFSGLQGVLYTNAILVPIKIIMIMSICVWALLHTSVTPLPQEIVQPPDGVKVAGHWAWSAILYVSYNMILQVAVLSSLGRSISKKEGIICGVIGGIGLGITAGIIVLAGLAFMPYIIYYQIPLLYLAQQVGIVWQKALGVLIWMAIITTAIANAHGFASRLAPLNSKQYKIIGMLAIVIVLPLAGMEFTKLIKSIYPLFGYMGLLLLFTLFFAPVYKGLFRR